MRPEDFDKRVQQKLEDINPVFNEQDWIRLSQKMNSRNTPGLFTKRIGIILLLLMLVFFGTWMSLKWTPGIPGSNKQQIDKGNHTPVIMANESKSVDDVFSNKSNPTTSEYNKSLEDETLDHSLSNKNIAKQKTITASKTKASTFNKRKHSTIFNEDKNNVKSYYNAERVNSVAKSNIAAENTLNNVKHADGFPTRLNNSTLSNPSDKVALGNYSEKIPGVSLTNEPLLEENKSLGAIAQSKLVVEPIQIPINNVSFQDELLLKFPLKPSAGFKPHKWTVGVTGLVTNSHWNTGLVFEIKTKKNISFGSGLVLQKYFKQTYLDQNDFSATNEAEFTEMIKPRYSKSISFTDIKIESMDILLPLNLKYYIPLSTRAAMFATGSMQLALYSKTSLGFQYLDYDTPGPMLESDFNQPSNSSSLINHFNIGVGFQTEFKNIICQTSFLLQKNNNNQPHIAKMDLAGQFSIFYKL